MSYKKHVYKVWNELTVLLNEEPSEKRNNKTINLINEIKILNSKSIRTKL
jgi:hypothetical protein